MALQETASDDGARAVALWLRPVAERLNKEYHLSGGDALDEWDVDRLILLCSFETNKDITADSKWCSIFSDGEVLAWEFARDLQSYFSLGYGRPTSDAHGNLC
jgi:hypothetical protein